MASDDRFGRMLVASGAVSEQALDELLELQKQPLPIASLCHVIGGVSEETLVLALSKKEGVPGVVLSQSVLELSVLESVPRKLALEGLVLPIMEDGQRVFCACAQPEQASEVIRQISFVKGKPVVPHVALHVVLLRFIRAAYQAFERGDTHLLGDEAECEPKGAGRDIYVVSDVDTVPPGEVEALAVEAVTREVSVLDVDEIEESEPGDTTSMATSVRDSDFFAIGSEETSPPVSLAGAAAEDRAAIELDSRETSSMPVIRGDGPFRVLIVDDDYATRHLLVKELGPEGYHLITATNGSEAIQILRSAPPDAIIIDVILPEIDGFQVCRSIKDSRRYRHIPVLLMSAVINSGQVTDDVLAKYGADGYFEKPLNTNRIRDALRSQLARAENHGGPVDDGSFDRALSLYRAGDLESAIAELREGIKNDPLSARHHFVLANLLQKESQLYEAIDEYEATIDLMPDYFPALTRLAYLYYKKGFAAKAIETWRRALPYCPDPNLRENIEVFMRKLIADMQQELS